MAIQKRQFIKPGENFSRFSRSRTLGENAIIAVHLSSLQVRTHPLTQDILTGDDEHSNLLMRGVH
jgi:hypothetical protein